MTLVMIPGRHEPARFPALVPARFLARWGWRVIEAAGLVGGAMEAAKAAVLLARLGVEPPDENDCHALVRLHRVLSLAEDPDEPRWIDLDPDSETVIRICLATDALERFLRVLAVAGKQSGSLPQLNEPTPADAPSSRKVA